MVSKTEAAVITAAVVAVAVVIGLAVYVAWTIHSGGEVITIGISADSNHIDWGRLYPNSTAQAVINFWGNGSVPVTLTLNVQNWQPELASEYLAITWNYSGEPIGAEHVPIAITLHVDEGVQGFRYFTVDLVVEAKEAQ